MNNKTLLIILVGLVVVYGLTQLFSGKKDRSFDTDLVKIDTSTVTKVVVFPKADDFAEVTLTREGSNWIITKGDLTTIATSNNVNSLLGQLSLIKTKRIAAKNSEKWVDYEVEDDKATRLQVYAGTKLLRDFMIGRFSFNQQTRQATSFVRLTGEDEVYAVDGFLSMSLGQGFDAYRNKEILNVAQADFTGLDFRLEDYMFSFNKSGKDWVMNNDINIPLDSALMYNLLNNIQNVSGSEFIDDFDPVQSQNLLQKSLTVNANNLIEPIVIHCYADTSREKPFVIHSSQNEEAYFASDSTGVYTRLFERVNEVLEAMQ